MKKQVGWVTVANSEKSSGELQDVAIRYMVAAMIALIHITKISSMTTVMDDRFKVKLPICNGTVGEDFLLFELIVKASILVEI